MVSLQDSAVFKSAQSQCHDASAGHEQSVAVNSTGSEQKRYRNFFVRMGEVL